MDLVLQGRVLSDEIDDFVEQWHDNDSAEEIYEYLGLSFEEYSLWVADPDNIEIIIYARHSHKPLTEAVNDNLQHEERIAARSDEAAKISALARWIAAQPDR
jgi:DNA-directed RNA polymerase specialized sigma subunit